MDAGTVSFEADGTASSRVELGTPAGSDDPAALRPELRGRCALLRARWADRLERLVHRQVLLPGCRGVPMPRHTIG